MCAEVLGGLLQEPGIMLETAESLIARAAQECPNTTELMVMVNSEPADCRAAVDAGRCLFRLTADGAEATLQCEHGVIVCQAQAIGPPKVPIIGHFGQVWSFGCVAPTVRRASQAGIP